MELRLCGCSECTKGVPCASDEEIYDTVFRDDVARAISTNLVYTRSHVLDGGQVVNLFVHYKIDANTSRHVLKLDDYGGDGVDSWVLLDALA